ncbi:hypothetical protein Y032_0003g1192 [Ancylostoma ceylanicum]|nr:hypothetical protein Y032_0003g1192 [Ancylostoma ceylanicum]
MAADFNSRKTEFPHFSGAWQQKGRESVLANHFPGVSISWYGPWMMRTTVGRSPSFTMDPIKDCGKDTFFEANRKKWSYYDKNGSELAITANVWSPNHPDSTCADLPRITALMSATGYIDVPAISRRPFICVTGVPALNRTVRRRDETCNRAAKYDATKKHCVCNNPDADGLVVDPKHYAHYPPVPRNSVSSMSKMAFSGQCLLVTASDLPGLHHQILAHFA